MGIIQVCELLFEGFYYYGVVIGCVFGVDVEMLIFVFFCDFIDKNYYVGNGIVFLKIRNVVIFDLVWKLGEFELGLQCFQDVMSLIGMFLVQLKKLKCVVYGIFNEVFLFFVDWDMN